MSGQAEKELEDKLYGREQVIEIINSVLAKVQSQDELSKDGLVEELRELHRLVEESVNAIAGVQPGDIQDKHIPTATDELEAVLGATEEATGTIMDACEAIQGKLDHMDSMVASVVEDEITRIFEACSFQDITGQRISKVVKAIKDIDEKVQNVLAAIGGQAAAATGDDERTGDDRLLNGPQLPENSVTQDDIDKILAEFDG